MSTLKESKESSSLQMSTEQMDTEAFTQEEKQWIERYDRFSRLRDLEIVREMHGLPPKYRPLSTQQADSPAKEF